MSSLFSGIKFVSKSDLEAERKAKEEEADRKKQESEEKQRHHHHHSSSSHHHHRHHQHPHSSSSHPPASSSSSSSSATDDHRRDHHHRHHHHHEHRRHRDHSSSSSVSNDINPLVEQRLREAVEDSSSSSSSSSFALPLPASSSSSSATESTNNGTVTSHRPRMDWMTDPNSLRAVLTKETNVTEVPPLTPSQIAEQERQRIIQSEIDRGLREPVTGLPYGLYSRKPGEKWLGGETKVSTTNSNTITTITIDPPLPAIDPPLSAIEINPTTRNKLLRPDAFVSSSSASSSSVALSSTPSDTNDTPSSSSVATLSSTTSTTTTNNAPSWKQKLLERQKEKSSFSSSSTVTATDNTNVEQDTAADTHGNRFSATSHKRPHSDLNSSMKTGGIDASALHKIIRGEDTVNTVDTMNTATIPSLSNPSASSSSSSSSLPLPVTEADFNRLHALSLRAQMMNDHEKYEQLQTRIRLGKEALRQPPSTVDSSTTMNLPVEKRSRIDHPSISSSSTLSVQTTLPPDLQPNETVEILSPLDAYGRPIPSLVSGKEAPLAKEDLRTGHRAGKLKTNLNSFTVDGERIGYLPEDVRSSVADAEHASSLSATDLLRMERTENSRTLDDTLMRNILRAGNHYKDNVFSSSDKTGKYEDDNTFDDDIAKAMTKQESRLTAHEIQERERQRAIRQQKLLTNVLTNCRFCIDSKTHARHLIISLGNYCYLSLPPFGPRLPGHLQLIPLPHIASIIDGEEELYEEINQYKLALHNYYASQHEGVLFLETSLPSHGNRKHTVIDIVPMDKEVADDAPLFFQKGILDAEEWTTNKTLINTAGKGLRKCIPKGFAYFHVAWAGGGFVHPIEDESTFSPFFGLDIAAGMVGELPGKFGYKEQKLTKNDEMNLVNEFIKKWEPYDFTLRKKGEGKETKNSHNGSGNSANTAVTASTPVHLSQSVPPSSATTNAMSSTSTTLASGINTTTTTNVSTTLPSTTTSSTTTSASISTNAPSAPRRRLL